MTTSTSKHDKKRKFNSKIENLLFGLEICNGIFLLCIDDFSLTAIPFLLLIVAIVLGIDFLLANYGKEHTGFFWKCVE